MKFNIFKLYIDLKLKFYPAYPKLKKFDVDKINTILAYSNTAIGDTLFNTPVFRSLKENFPTKKLIVILNPVNYKLFENNIYIDEIILYDGKWKTFFKTLKRLQEYKIDLSLILHSNEPQATPLAVLSNSKYIIKIPNNKNKFHKFHNNTIISSYNNKHGIFDRLRCLEYLNIKSENPNIDLFIDEESINNVDDYFNSKNINPNEDILIGFQIGASTVSRMWFEEKWIELANKLLLTNKNIKIILTGSPSERRLTNAVFSKVIEKDRIFDLAGYFDLKSAAVLIKKLNVLVVPDTGPMHIAIALKTPTVGLFVVAELIKSSACYDKELHLYIKKSITCIPCFAKKCKFQKCMYQITVDEVIEKITILLKRRK
jgi:ADP-heptose:LPS heptosyltransferase